MGRYLTKRLALNISQWLADWLPALPLLVIAYGMLVAPIVMLLVQSFLRDDGSFTLANWIEVFASKRDRQAILTSLQLGIVSASTSLFIGSPIAWSIARMATVQRSSWLALLNMATHFSGIGLAFGFIAILGTYGMLTLSLQRFGIAFTPPTPSSFWGLAIVYAYVNIPLFILLTIPGMAILSQEWWEAAQTAGATQWQFWRSIGLPILAPFLGASWILVFTWAIGLYGLPLALGSGATYSTPLITLQIADILTTNISGQGEAAVFAMLLLLLASICLFSYRWMLRRAMRWF
jgi:putative spermidine/putrescine transport system permease protein